MNESLKRKRDNHCICMRKFKEGGGIFGDSSVSSFLKTYFFLVFTKKMLPKAQIHVWQLGRFVFVVSVFNF